MKAIDISNDLKGLNEMRESFISKASEMKKLIDALTARTHELIKMDSIEAEAEYNEVSAELLRAQAMRSQYNQMASALFHMGEGLSFSARVR